MNRSDGSTADYYVLPEGATQLQDLISHRNMNAQIGEIIRACYRYGMASHSDMLRDAKKIRFYAQAEVERLEKLETASEQCENPCEFLDPSVWGGAPKWANYLAMDKCGKWHWYQNEPYQHRTESWFNQTPCEGQWVRALNIDSPQQDWTKTLSRRPK